MKRNILLCGVGGQGTVLASKLIAQAAMEKGYDAFSAETIGMAQRGGSVVSHVRFGEGIHSPLIPFGKADILIGFEPGEAVRMLPYLKPDGLMVVNPEPVQPVTASLGIGQYDIKNMLPFLEKEVLHLVIVDGNEICQVCQSAKVLNIALLGAAAASGELEITLEELEAALIKKIPAGIIDVNKRAMQMGAEAIKKSEVKK